MFQSKSKQTEHYNATTIVGTGTTINGNINSEGDLRVDGKVLGDVSGSGKVFVGAEGEIVGNLSCQNADILGRINGSLKIADLLQLKGKAWVEGDIFAEKLQMEPTCNFNGQCHMGGASVVNLHQDLPKQAIL